MEDPENLGSGMAGAGDSLVKQYPPVNHQFLEVPISLLGYCDADVDRAIAAQLQRGISFSLPTRLEAEVAERIVAMVPCAEMVRFGKNGTDATSAAVRVARAVTGKNHVLALGYHGWQDWYVGATLRNKGVPKATRQLTHKLPFNDLAVVESAFDTCANDVACVILEPMSDTEPMGGYLANLRSLTRARGCVLIFDETVTGFRFAKGGAQELFDVTPDLCTLGKGIANGMPLSAVAGHQELMAEFEDIFISSTFGGETLSLAAARAVLDKLDSVPVIERIWRNGGVRVSYGSCRCSAHGFVQAASARA